MEFMKLSKLDVLHIGPDTFPIDRDIRAVSIRRLNSDIEPL